jgi:dTDP-4-dehydrorhamnose reductase
MRVAITGTTGRVGAALARHLGARHDVIPLTREQVDLAAPESLAAALDPIDCEVFIHPAAMTSLEACEDDPSLAARVNSDAPGRIARWAAERGVRMIHFSTDYVFDGESTVSLTEDMPANPVNVYGTSKLAGEAAVLGHPGHLVLRVSWVFGPDKDSFVDQIFHAALAAQPLAAVGDKYCLPTSAVDLALWTEALLETREAGLLHACNPGPAVSWHGMAEHVVREMTLDRCPEVKALKLDEMSAFRALRPRFTPMNPARLSRIAGPLRPWQDALSAHVRARCAAL